LIAAMARRHGGIVLHKDPELAVLAGQEPVEALPYKTAARDATGP
jgi:hypothetical protein